MKIIEGGGLRTLKEGAKENQQKEREKKKHLVDFDSIIKIGFWNQR